MKQSFNIDKRAIGAILFEKDIRPFLRARITKSFFKTEQSRVAYAWIQRYHDRFSKVPSRALFLQQFPGFEIHISEEPLSFFAEALTQRKTREMLVQCLADTTDALQQGPEEARKVLTAAMERIQVNSHRATDMALSDDTKALYERYEKRKGIQGILGIPFGFAPLDEITDGMVAGQLSLLFGDQGVGKSWLALIIAIHALLSGRTVLYVSKENLASEISNRIHAFLAKVNPHRLRRGLLDSWDEKKLSRFEPYFSRIGRNFHVSTQDDVDGEGMGTRGVIEKIRQYNPDIVFVDGLYLLEDDDLTGPEHMVLRKIAYRLKRMARKENTHVFAVTQSNAQGAAAENGASSASDIAFSRMLAAACDVILNIYDNEELRMINCKGIKLLKQREGPQTLSMVCEWDFEKCAFGVIDSETTTGDDEEPDLPS